MDCLFFQTILCHLCDTLFFADMSYDPLLMYCFDGLCETEHPYVFISRQAIHDLLTAPVIALLFLPPLVKIAAADG